MLIKRGMLKLGTVAAQEKTRYAMNGILVERHTDGTARLVATNGKMLAMVNVHDARDVASFPCVSGVACGPTAETYATEERAIECPAEKMDTAGPVLAPGERNEGRISVTGGKAPGTVTLTFRIGVPASFRSRYFVLPVDDAKRAGKLIPKGRGTPEHLMRLILDESTIPDQNTPEPKDGDAALPPVKLGCVSADGSAVVMDTRQEPGFFPPYADILPKSERLPECLRLGINATMLETLGSALSHAGNDAPERETSVKMFIPLPAKLFGILGDADLFETRARTAIHAEKIEATIRNAALATLAPGDRNDDADAAHAAALASVAIAESASPRVRCNASSAVAESLTRWLPDAVKHCLRETGHVDGAIVVHAMGVSGDVASGIIMPFNINGENDPTPSAK